jgi:hypothetical protein
MVISHERAHLKLVVGVGGLVLVKDGLLDNLGSLLDLLLDAGSGGGLLGHAVGLDLGVGLLGGGDLVAAVVADELGKSLDGAGTAVLDGLVLRASLEELDGGEARDVIGNVVGGGVNLGDGDLVGEGRVLLGQLVVLGCKGLAVSAPRGVVAPASCFSGMGSLLMLGSTLPATKSSTKEPIAFLEMSLTAPCLV